MKYNEMSTIKTIEYINSELVKNRTMKEIEEVDFEENKGVIQKRLNRKGYLKMNNQFVSAKDNNTDRNTTKLHQEQTDTTVKTTKIIHDNNTSYNTEKLQAKPIDNELKMAFSNDEIDKINQLLSIDINTLNKMINEYNTKQTTISSIDIKDTTTTVTSLRLNKEIYSLIKEKSAGEGIGISEMINKCMLDYLSK